MIVFTFNNAMQDILLVDLVEMKSTSRQKMDLPDLVESSSLEWDVMDEEDSPLERLQTNLR